MPDGVYRRVHPKWVRRDVDGQIIPGPDGLPVMTSEGFKTKGSGVSVALGSVLLAENRLPSSLITDYPGYGLAWLSEADILAIEGVELRVQPDPKPPEEPEHANIVGATKSTPKKLAQVAHWEVAVPD
jgi:hypothetical protein